MFLTQQIHLLDEQFFLYALLITIPNYKKKTTRQNILWTFRHAKYAYVTVYI